MSYRKNAKDYYTRVTFMSVSLPTQPSLSTCFLYSKYLPFIKHKYTNTRTHIPSFYYCWFCKWENVQIILHSVFHLTTASFHPSISPYLSTHPLTFPHVINIQFILKYLCNNFYNMEVSDYCTPSLLIDISDFVFVLFAVKNNGIMSTHVSLYL